MAARSPSAEECEMPELFLTYDAPASTPEPPKPPSAPPAPDEEAPETPPTEPAPVPVDDPPSEPSPRGPYVV